MHKHHGFRMIIITNQNVQCIGIGGEVVFLA